MDENERARLQPQGTKVLCERPHGPGRVGAVDCLGFAHQRLRE
jgi:hypothetical protein